MASTTPTHVDTSIPEVWAKRVLRQHLISGFWGKFVGGEGSGSPITQKTDLLNSPGDTIHIQVTTPLVGAGVSGDTTALVGSEENLTTSEMTVVPTFYRHGVRWYRRADKKSIVDLRSEARMRLAEWGEEKMDDLRFANFTSTANLNGATYTPNTYFVKGTTDSSDAGTTITTVDVAAGDHITVDDVQRIKLKLVLQNAKPIKSVDGLPFYAMVVHPYCLYNLKREQEYRDWVREAHVRGADNPMFLGATAIIDGMVLYEHPNVPVALSGNPDGSVNYATNIAFGSEAFCEGVDENPTWDEDSFDYNNEFGIAYKFAFQPRRALALSSCLVYAEAVTVA
jgi:N4-gp56 family major capsid protein